MKKGDQTKQRLVDAAAGLLQTRGYHGTGINQVIAESGAPKGSLYFHFPGGKEELAACAVRAAGAEWQSAIVRVLDAAPNLAEGARAVCRYLAEVLRDSNYGHGCPVATVALESAPHSDPIHEACTEVYQGWQGLVEDRLGALGVSADRAAGLATAVVSMVEGAMLLSKAHRSTEPLDRVGDEAVRFLALALTH